jgi:hypothetical protein
VIAGLSTGVIDSVLTLAANPDPASLSYRVSYALGPLLLALAWAIPVGLVAGALHSPAAAAGAVVALWLASLLVDAAHAGRAAPLVVPGSRVASARSPSRASP